MESNYIQKTKSFYNHFHHRQEPAVVDFLNNQRYLFLKKKMASQKGNVLVVGCGSKNEMDCLNNQCDGVGLDISEVAIKKCRQRYPNSSFVVGDAQALPFSGEKFDCLVCSEVIEHLPNDEKFIIEAFRVLKPRGRLLITTPNWISFFGLARKTGEWLLKRPLTMGDQPIDHWSTYWSLKKKILPKFDLIDCQGIWYFPPFGRGRYYLPDRPTMALVKIFNPLSIALGSVIPHFGTILCFDLRKRS